MVLPNGDHITVIVTFEKSGLLLDIIFDEVLRIPYAPDGPI